jgi:hypothetical protein
MVTGSTYYAFQLRSRFLRDVCPLAIEISEMNLGIF